MTTVELYNLTGRRIDVLYNNSTQEATPISISYDVQRIESGLYIAVIRNGSELIKEKISIVK